MTRRQRGSLSLLVAALLIRPGRRGPEVDATTADPPLEVLEPCSWGSKCRCFSLPLPPLPGARAASAIQEAFIGLTNSLPRMTSSINHQRRN